MLHFTQSLTFHFITWVLWLNFATALKFISKNWYGFTTIRSSWLEYTWETWSSHRWFLPRVVPLLVSDSALKFPLLSLSSFRFEIWIMYGILERRILSTTFFIQLCLQFSMNSTTVVYYIPSLCLDSSHRLNKHRSLVSLIHFLFVWFCYHPFYI